MMSKRLFIGLVLIIIGLYWFSIKNDDRGSLDQAGQGAPDFTLRDEKGNRVSLSDYRGKVVLIHFWATWCAPCAEEFPLLDQFQKKFSAADPFIILPISVDESGRKAVETFRRKIPFDMTVLFDPEGNVADKYGTFRLPESYLIDKEGKIIQKIVGPQSWSEPRWERKIRSLLE